MKRMRIAGLCLLAVGAVFAFTSSAFATEGSLEFGKCLKKEGGVYKNSGCTKKAGASAEEHKFEWEPLSGKTFKFTSAKKAETGNAVLEGPEKAGKKGNSVSCTGLVQKVGEYGPGKVEVKNVIGEFSGCEGLGAKCSNEGKAEGLINTEKLKGELGVVTKNATNEEKNVVGSDLVGEPTEFLAKFTCGGLPVTVKRGVVVKVGAVVSGTFKSNTNKMLTKATVEFKAAPGGTQEPNEWTPAGSGVSHSSKTTIKEFLEAKFGPSPAEYETSGQSLVVIQKSNPTTAKLEIRQCKQNVC
jgi:hypothetical protein